MLQSFRGQSGRAYRFNRVDVDAPWASETGVALFAARGPYGWRIVRLVGLNGQPHNVQPVWAFADAQRYGATAVFVCRVSESLKRVEIFEDLEAGLNPVLGTDTETLAAPTRLAA
ncbi:MAG: hypothetical protein AAGJ84_10790 [Pseudomonadota bacterium]